MPLLFKSFFNAKLLAQSAQFIPQGAIKSETEVFSGFTLTTYVFSVIVFYVSHISHLCNSNSSFANWFMRRVVLNTAQGIA